MGTRNSVIHQRGVFMFHAVIIVIKDYSTFLLWVAPSWYFFFYTPPFSQDCLFSGVKLFMANVLTPVSPQ